MFHWIRLRAFAYSTEDEDRVIQAMRNVMDGDLKISHAEGAYGDIIKIIEVNGKKDRNVKQIISSLHEKDRKALLETVEERTDDDSVFHFRFGKQEAYLGEMALSFGGDVISLEMKVESYPSSREKAVESMKKYLEALI